MASDTNSQKLSGLGSLDFSSVSKAVANSSGSKRKYIKNGQTDKDFRSGNMLLKMALLKIVH